MRRTMHLVIIALTCYWEAPAQTFEVASIKPNEPRPGFHIASDAVSFEGGTFRCTQCSLTTLIARAFNLQPYQFPGRTALKENSYDVVAKIGAGASGEQLPAMLQNLLKDRFGLAWHYQEKVMKGYKLVVTKSGAKLVAAAGTEPHRTGPGGSHEHSGVMAFGTSSSYRAANRTIAELAVMLSDQIDSPVADGTGIAGRYDISLRWSASAAARPETHSEGHMGHGGGEAWSGGSDLTIFDALQEQLGLKLVRAEQVTARLFIVDRILQRPQEN